MFNIELIKKLYAHLPQKIKFIKEVLNRELTLSEKILFSHVIKEENSADKLIKMQRGETYVEFNPDRVAMQDATAQMALLQFMQSKRPKVAVPSSVHCDHLILAESGAKEDLNNSINNSKEVFDFLSSVCNKYGIDFWKPGAGIIHQVILENYAFPGLLVIGTDSHTPNAGGLASIAIGVGGADACDVMAGLSWELKLPKLIGVKLTGKLNGWASPKDIILKLAGILTVKGGTGYIVEYFGEGAQSISCTGKATICNMGAEIGATTSLFGYDEKMSEYLIQTGRKELVDLASSIKEHLTGDKEVYDNPDKFFNYVIEIDLSTVEPYINGPFTPDAAMPISKVKEMIKDSPRDIRVGLIGSCTNSSYEDLGRAASIANQAIAKKLNVKSKFTVTPGSEQILATTKRDGLLKSFEDIGGVILANACGPCIGQWKRKDIHNGEVNTIVTSFNRNFAKRNDGNPDTHAFVASPEIVTALSIAGDLYFNPLTDTLINENGENVKLDPPLGDEFPPKGFTSDDLGYVVPAENGSSIEIKINPNSDRLQLLHPFLINNSKDFTNLKLLIKAEGKCTTDHISMAGPWLKYRGHLENISNNMLIGAVNYFNNETNKVKNQLTGEYGEVPKVQKYYKANKIGTIVVGEENYGEGSSREHAAMEPRFLGVKVILVKSFARIHETNLKKQGMLAVVFDNRDDYNKIEEDDSFNILGLDNFAPNSLLQLEIVHKNGSKDTINIKHSYNETQIEWFKAGSALNIIKNNLSA